MKKVPQVLLIGDSCTDIYTYVELSSRSNPEAPSAPLYTTIKKVVTHGMVLNVSRGLTNLGLETFTLFPDPGIITKLRIIDNKTGNQLMRIDYDKPLEEVNLEYIDFSKFDSVVISDYNKGYVSDKTIKFVEDNFTTGPIFLDTKKTNISDFSSCIKKINLAEANAANSIDTVTIVTLGDKGCRGIDKNRTIVPTLKVNPVDTCGAGDAFLTGLVYGFSNLSNESEDALVYANVNAAISVQHMGVYQPSLEELLKGVELYEQTVRGS